MMLSMDESTRERSNPTPMSSGKSQSDFDALIELLATDGPIPTNSNESSTEDQDLRDQEGKLDFGKIQALFTSKTSTEDGDSASRERRNVNLVTGDDVRAINFGENFSRLSIGGYQEPGNPEGNRDKDAGLSGAQAESTPHGQTQPSQPNYNILIDLTSNNQYRVDNGIPSVSSLHLPSLALPLEECESPSALDSIRTALSLANKEVDELRQRCKELESLIHETRREASQASVPEKQPVNQQRCSPFIQSPSSDTEERPTHDDVASFDLLSDTVYKPDIDSLSLSQARYIVKALLDDLALPQSLIHDLLQRRHGRNQNVTPASYLHDILRAKELTIFVDELVWRRSRMGAEFDNRFCEENIQSLKERLELWERAVRTRR